MSCSTETLKTPYKKISRNGQEKVYEKTSLKRYAAEKEQKQKASFDISSGAICVDEILICLFGCD